MAGSIDIRPSFVEFAVDEESGSIDTGLIPIAQDMTGFIHENEIRRLDGGEMLSKGVEPDEVAVDRIT